MVKTREKMKVILLYVSSLDGKVTKWGQSNIYSWTSPEDIAHFKETIKKSSALVMGSNTYNAVHPKPEEGVLRIVLTSKPEKYANYSVPGQLEFYDLSPEDVIETLKQPGHKQVLLVSGKRLSTAFLKKKLVDELWLTVEPRIFGTGDGIVIDEQIDITLTLQTVSKLNEKGTLLLKYKIDK